VRHIVKNKIKSAAQLVAILVSAYMAGCASFKSGDASISHDTKPANAPTTNTAIIPATRSNPTNWFARHEKFVAEAKMGGIQILFLGDSITDGWRSRGSNVWNQFYAPRHAANFGIGGDRIQHVLWRIENGELDGINPKVIVLMIGTNNSDSNSPDQISEGIEKIVAEIRHKRPRSKILLLAIFPRNRATAKPAQMEIIHQVNKRIAKLDNGKTIVFLDINKVFLDAEGKVRGDLMPDFLHPNAHGYELWANAMEPTLAKLLK
jgi:lysophospholipase L1-like esterase